MAKSLRILRRKIRTTESIWQITRAMSMVAAVQLRRVQSGVEQRRDYFQRLSEILARISASDTPVSHPYLDERPKQGRVGLILAAGDRGLCGSYNANIFRLAEQFMRDVGCQVDVIAIGAKTVAYARRHEWHVVDAYGSLKDVQETEKANQICRQIRQYFDTGQLDSLHIAYTEFISPARHVASVEQVLPIAHEIADVQEAVEYIHEPEAAELINTLLPMAVEAKLRFYLIQSLASEQAARMMAMTASSDNAEDMRDGLVRQLNQARQHKITSEVLEVATGAEALGQA